MAFLYLTEQGAVLAKTGERLTVTKDDQTLLDIPVSDLDGVLVFGHVHLTTPALQLCLSHEVELALFTRRGRLLGQLTSPFPKNIELRQAQYRRAADAAFTLSLSQTLIAAKLGNALEFLREFAHNHPDTDLAQETAQVSAARDQAAQAPDPARLLGLEGAGARAYFAGFAKMLRHSFSFTGRARHPAPDPVNALLSLGYTLVYNELSSLLDGMGFDPYLGFYHQPRFGHATLASDLLEEFRVPLVDRLTLYLVNNRIVQEPDFYTHTSGGVYLLDDPRKRYFQEYERFVTRSQGAAADDPEMDFRRLFRRQAQRLRQTVLTGEPYAPFIFSWK
ncbi:MAG: CRISPR-associated endonuclease Cas1 [Deltaproteobacteria bacterium]|nr:CRISPR-associated endonuclease Cas1 [Deltaproteobacteria bacterium]